MTTAHDKTETLKTLTAKQILAVPKNEPERIFTGEEITLKTEFKALSKLWHPDLNKDKEASAVFAHINELNASAKKKLEAGHWVTPNLLRLRSKDGRSYELKYLKKHSFELGAFYISNSTVTYVIDKDTGADLAENGLRTLKDISFSDDKLRQEFARALPELIKSFETQDAIVCVFKKDPQMILLSDLRDHVLETTGKPLDSKHVAWITSRLLNMSCFLQLSGLTSNGMTAETVFVSPEMHTAVFMGWWYATEENTRLKGLPGTALDVVPRDVLTNGIASRRIDLEMVRAVGRDLLGDPTGSLLLRDKNLPKPFAQWLTNTTSGNAYKDFQNWSEDVLKSSFGARRFTVLDVSFSDVYQPH